MDVAWVEQRDPLLIEESIPTFDAVPIRALLSGDEAGVCRFGGSLSSLPDPGCDGFFVNNRCGRSDAGDLDRSNSFL